MSWPAHESLDALVRDAATIVIGTVTASLPGNSIKEFMRVDGVPIGMPFTTSLVQVEQALTGPVRAGETIHFWQEGSRHMHPVTSTTFALLEVRLRYLLFVGSDWPSGLYRPVGGPQGVYRIDDDTVRPLDQYENRAIGIAGRRVDKVVRAVADART